VLADTYVLYSKTMAFTGNVTGPMFTSLHALFMEQYTELFEAIDELAERIRVPQGSKHPMERRPFPAAPLSVMPVAVLMQ